MDSSQLLGITTFTYMLSTILYAAIFIFKAKKLGPATTIFTIVAFLIQTAGLLLRWKESYTIGYGHAPLTDRKSVV